MVYGRQFLSVACLVWGDPLVGQPLRYTAVSGAGAGWRLSPRPYEDEDEDDWSGTLSGILNRMSKEIDRVRATSALEVIKQHPGLVLFAASPLIALVAVTWVFAGTGWGIALALVLLVTGGAFVVLKR